jgi:hypothetical protein
MLDILSWFAYGVLDTDNKLNGLRMYHDGFYDDEYSKVYNLNSTTEFLRSDLELSWPWILYTPLNQTLKIAMQNDLIGEEYFKVDFLL